MQISNVGHVALDSAASREISPLPLVKSLIDTGMTMQQSGGRLHPAIDNALTFFVGDRAREYFYGRDDPDGRFLQTKKLQDVFDQGPGAVVGALLRFLPHEKASDDRYGLVLQMASLLGLHSFVKLPLDRGVDVNLTGYYYGTALQAAARCGHHTVAELLIAAGADVNILQGRHQTALRAAVVGGHAGLINFLTQKGAQLELRFKHEQLSLKDKRRLSPTILRLAVQQGDPDIVRCILNAGADVSDEVNGQRHSIFYACEHGSLEILRLLVSAGSPIDITDIEVSRYGIGAFNHSPLHAASSSGQDEVVRYLLAEGATFNVFDESHSPLALAAVQDHASTVRVLLEGGYSRQNEVSLALQNAASSGHEAVVGEFIRWGVCDSQFWRALGSATKSRRVSIVKLLMKSRYGASLASNELDQVLEHVSKQDQNIFAVLLRYTKLDGNALVTSCRVGSLSAVRFCVDHSISPDCANDNGHRGLHVAAYHLNLEVVTYLVSRGADINFVDPVLGSPLVATLDGYLEAELSELQSRLQNERNERSCERSMSREGSNMSSDSGTHHGSGRSLSVNDGGQPDTASRLEHNEGSDSPLDLQHCDRFDPSSDVNDRGAVSLRSIPARQNIECRKPRNFVLPLRAECKLENPGPSSREAQDCEEIIRHLLDHDAMIDSNIGPFGNALHLASFMGRESLVCLLLDRGADVNASGGFFQTALFAALENGNADIANLLVERGCRISYCPQRQTTPLHLACSKGLNTVVSTLLKAGCDVNTKCGKGLTALDAVIQYERMRENQHVGCWRKTSNASSIIRTLLEDFRGPRVEEDGFVTAAKEKPRGVFSRLSNRDQYLYDQVNIALLWLLFVIAGRDLPLDEVLFCFILCSSCTSQFLMFPFTIASLALASLRPCTAVPTSSSESVAPTSWEYVPARKDGRRVRLSQ